METRKFRTRTITMQRKNPYKKEDTWPLAMDMGYSSVKVMSRNALACFPRYAMKLAKNTIDLARPNDYDILYKDTNTGNIYAVGQNAQEMISIESTNDSSAVLYGRNCYFSEIFKVTSRVGLALGVMANEFGSPEGKKIKVQTGLPPKYMEDDKALLKEALSGDFDF